MLSASSSSINDKDAFNSDSWASFVPLKSLGISSSE